MRPNEMGEAIAAISRWVDQSPANASRDREARSWGRLAKVSEEAGEAIAAFTGATGQNPRKGVTGCVAEVIQELLDVAVTALAAVEHFSGNDGSSVDELAEHVTYLIERAEIVYCPGPAASGTPDGGHR